MPPRRAPSSRRGRGRGRRQGADETPINPEITAAVNQAISSIFPTLVTQLADAIRQQPNQGQTGSGNTHTGTPPTGPSNSEAHHVWIGRFEKLKPQSFTSAPTPVDAENWINHIKKICDALGCSDNQMVRLAVYKLEGDAQSWWDTLKQIKGGDSYVDSLTWAGFCEVFFQQYFSSSDKDFYVREYASIRQDDKESVTEYLARFVRLTRFAGAAAGSARDQAEKFKWSVHDRIRSKIISMRFADVAEAANAAKDIEKERIDYESKHEKKRSRDGHPYRRPEQKNQENQDGQNSGNQQGPRHGPNQNHNRQLAQSNAEGRSPVRLCNTCGKIHSGFCYKESGACYRCGQVGHRVKDCKSPGNEGNKDNVGKNTSPLTMGRVFTLNAGQTPTTPRTATGTLIMENT